MGCGQGHMTHFQFWGPQWYLWNGLSHNNQILHTGRMYQILAYRWQTTPKGGVVEVTWPILNINARNHISGMAEARVTKFCMQVEHIKC